MRIGAVDKVVAQVVAVAATLSTLAFFWTPGAGVDRFLNSDLLYLPALFDDLGRGGRLSDWRLTPAPYLFPDMLIFGAAWLFSRGQQVLPWLVAAIQAGLWCPAVMLLSDRTVRDGSSDNSWIPSALVLHAALAIYRQGGAGAMAPFLVLTYHAGQALLGGVVLGVMHHGGRWRFGGGLVFVLLGAISDPFFVAGFLFALVIDILTTAEQLKGRLMRAIAVVVAAVLGLGVRGLLPLPMQQSGLFSWHRTLEAVTIFQRTVAESGGQLALVLWFIAVLFAVAAWRLGHSPRVLVVWCLVGLSSVAGAVLVGAPTAYPDSRYLTSHALALAAVFSVSLASLFPLPRLWRVFAVLAVVHSASVVYACRRHLADFARVENQFVSCFQSLRLDVPEPLFRCVGGYWAAKPVGLYSVPRVVALQVKPDGTPDWFVSTRREFSEAGPIDCAIFPVAEVGIFLGRYGAPSYRKDCGPVSVLAYVGQDKVRLNTLLLPVLAQPAVPSSFF